MRFRPLFYAVSAILTSLPVGCASSNAVTTRPLKPYLLFDRYDGGVVATGIPPRQDWPSVTSGRQIDEHIVFQERFDDHQGRTRNVDNEFSRWFTTYRTGRISR